ANLLSPISADIKYYYGWNLFMAGQLEEALQTINECLKYVSYKHIRGHETGRNIVSRIQLEKKKKKKKEKKKKKKKKRKKGKEKRKGESG
ncbi:hypothetical protein AIY50_07340, partial [Salmonella enterica]